MEQTNTGDVSQAVVAPAASVEKMVPQSTVDTVIKAIKHESYEKGMAQGRLEASTHQTPIQQSGGLSADEVRKLVAEEAQKLAAQEINNAQIARGTQVLEQFASKLEDAKSRYPDIEEKVGSLPLRNIPTIIGMANGMENTAEIMLDLHDNPTKIANLIKLQEVDPTGNLARKEMQKLSNSIKKNETAKTAKLPNEPLTKIQPSSASTDNGVFTLKDAKRKYTF